MGLNKKRDTGLRKVASDNVYAMDEHGSVYTATKTIHATTDKSTEFYQMYAKVIGVINGFTSLADVKVMCVVMQMVNFNDTTVYLNITRKQEINSQTGLSISSIERSIRNLVACQILVKDMANERSAMYYLNPTYIFFGSTDVRRVQLKVVLEIANKNGLPDKERKEIEDIKRYTEFINKQENEVHNR
jgi:predicted transcriptional regulator